MFPERTDDPRALEAAAVLAKMAELVTQNAANGFSGVFVIVPPGEGDGHTTLLLDPSESVPAFWNLVQGKAALALAELEKQERENAGGFMGGRR